MGPHTPEAGRGAAAAYDPLAAAYDTAQGGHRWDVYDHVTWATVAPHLPPPGSRVLDAGAGSGKFALRFLERGDEVTLLDPSRAMLDVAQAKVGARFPAARARFVEGSIERLDFPDGAFDFVFCEGDPLSYCITTHRAAARELLRVLRRGGGFYASVDNRWVGALGFLLQGQPERALAAAERGEALDPYGMPVHAFGAAELQRLFEQAGAAEVRVSGKMVLLGFLPDAALQGLFADEARRRRFFDLEAALAADPAMAALAGHLHAVGRKGGP